MRGPIHIDLFVEGAPGGAREPVEVEPLGDGRFRVLHSPGFVEGIAAGDVVAVTDPESGRFEVLERGGNLSIKVMGDRDVAPIRERLLRELEGLGGCCDGSIDKAAVFTVPVRAGFAPVERVMEAAVAAHPGFVWCFGNVYGEDGTTPLDWWRAFLEPT